MRNLRALAQGSDQRTVSDIPCPEGQRTADGPFAPLYAERHPFSAAGAPTFHSTPLLAL